MNKIVRKELGVIKSCQGVFDSVGDRLLPDFLEKKMDELFVTSIIYWKHNITFNICMFSPIFSN